MKDASELVEKAAKALCRAGGRDCEDAHPCDRYPVCICPFWKRYLDEARAVLIAVLPDCAPIKEGDQP